MSTRVAVMDQGRALQVAPPRELFRRPADITVATFIGTPAMNIIPATVMVKASDVLIEVLGKRMPVAVRHRAALGQLEQVLVGIRPHAIKLVSPGPEVVTGRVFLREPLGLEDEVLVETSDGTRVRVVVAAGDDLQEGSEVGLALETEATHLFQRDSGITIGGRLT